ncbi:1-acyl-sn-glycerol-3-phosphate acyltransferase [Okibacterium sp. HSC-33S16]|uniref:lysophospholipid acyltransferase family protein n=1 Tax=Okibacterium sp. HSC-33S16 TaxID=2910965 RepID=UPI0020A11BE2|nr:lysophospholipid acyltransferase family protein [Okibacterium sp. HSC-33S16]MCP2030479.1 1-acyl-sn-glycerol-3-phosphate acyltransferase [Okibacterium sp. HSC-33S16]
MRKRPSEPVYSTAIATGRALFGALRLKQIVTGAENIPATGGAVLAITHFGYMDFALTEWMIWGRNRRRVRFLAKKGAFDKPVVGWLLRGMRHISVDMKAGAEAFSQAIVALKAGEMLGVFPEAGVNTSFTVRELKTGTIRMAAEAHVPVIPIAVWGGHRLLTKGRKPSFREAWGTPISYVVGEAFSVDPSADPRESTLKLRATMQALLDTAQARYPDDGTGTWWQPAHLGGTAPTPEEAAVSEAERQRRKAREAEARSK